MEPRRLRTADPLFEEAGRLRAELEELRQENRRYARELENLRAAAQVSVDELDSHVLTSALARQSAATLHAERAMVALIEVGRPVVSACLIDGAIAREEPVSCERGTTVAGWVLQRRQPFLSHEPPPFFAPAGQRLQPSFAAGRPCRNLLAVPIINHQRSVIGIIEIHNRRDRALLSAQEIRAAEVLALLAAVGLERARLYDRMHDWSKSLETLLAFNAAVNQHLSPAQLIRRLVESAARFLKADGGLAGLAVPSEDGDGACMASDAYWAQGRWHEEPRRWRRREGIPGTVLESEFPYLANEYPQDRLADPVLVRDFEVGRALSVPIKNTEHQVLGFFELHKSAAQPPFTWQDAAFLESLGNTTAVAIHNAQLLKALEIRNQQVRALSVHNLQRLEEDRRHIARELHDEAGQALIGIKLGLQVLARRLPADMPEVRVELDQLREQVNASTAQLKDLARRLRPATLDQLGLDVALAQLAADFERLSGVAVEVDLDRPAATLPQDRAIAIYRIAQEAFTNTGKHAAAGRVRLALWASGGQITLEYEDDGRGFDPLHSSSGLGLLGMRERATMHGGRLTIRSRPGGGVRLTLEVPWG